MIDLRSDTVTQPTAEMLEAMYAARLGDDCRPLMSAIHPKADIAGRRLDVRFVPEADINELFNNVVRLHPRRNGLGYE